MTRTAWALDPETRTLHAEVDIPNPDGRLRPGMYAEVTVELGDSQSGLIVPLATVARRQKQSWCFVAENGKAVRKAVTLGINDGTRVEITSGLADQDLVIANPTGLTDGEPVGLVEPPSAK